MANRFVTLTPRPLSREARARGSQNVLSSPSPEPVRAWERGPGGEGLPRAGVVPRAV